MVKNVSDYPEDISSFGMSEGNNFFINKQISPNLSLLWESDTYGSYTNTSFVTNDTLVLASDLGGRITSFSIFDGKETGQIKNSGGIEQTGIILKNRLFFIVNDIKEKYSTFIVYDILNGKEISAERINGRFSTELLRGENSVIAVSTFGTVYSISPQGKINWRTDLDTEVYANSAIDENLMYIPSYNGKIYIIRADNGNITGEYELGSEIESGISLDNENIYLGDGKGRILAVKKTDGNLVWDLQTGYKFRASPSFDDRNVYIGNMGGEFYSVSKKDGKLNWKTDTGGLINTSPLVFKNMIIQANLFKKMDIIDKDDGEVLNFIEFDSRCRTTPIFFRDRLFIGIDKGEILCYGFTE